MIRDLLVTFDVFRSIGYRLSRNDYSHPNQENGGLAVFHPFKDNYGFTIGLAYRIMNEHTKKEVK